MTDNDDRLLLLQSKLSKATLLLKSNVCNLFPEQLRLINALLVERSSEIRIFAVKKMFQVL